MSKRWLLRDLQWHDSHNEDCAVRELEIVVDDAIWAPGYGLQFWKDVQLYGVDEAILYVKNDKRGDADALEKAWAKIQRRVQRKCKVWECDRAALSPGGCCILHE